MKKLFFTLIVSLTFCGSLFAQEYETYWPGFSMYNFADQKGFVAGIIIDGVPVTIEDFDNWNALEVVAFVGDEQRSYGMYLTDEYHLQYGDPYPIIDGTPIYFTNPGETVSFKMYDHMNNILYEDFVLAWYETDDYDLEFPGYSEEFVTQYAFDCITGEWVEQGWYYPANPAFLCFTTPGGAGVSQTLNLPEDWTWFSSYVEYGADAMDQLQASISLTNNNALIKNVLDFNQCTNGSWVGSLVLNNEGMYMTKLEAPATHTFTGAKVNPASHPINLAPDWTWIPYLSDVTMTVNEAFANVNANAGDQIKSSSAFASYNGTTWVPDTYVLEPGSGYMYSNTGAAKTLIYPSSAKSVVVPQADMRHWRGNHKGFPTNLTMMVTLDPEMFDMSKDSHEIGAFVNGECRGSAMLMNVDGIYMAFLTVSGEMGEEVCFRLFDARNNEEFAGTAEERISYFPDAIIGKLKAPMMLHFRTTGLNENGEVSLFPNPTKDKVMIMGQGIETVKVYNAMGQLLYTEVCGNTDNLELNLGSLSAGVYTVNILMVNGQQSNRLIVKE